MYVTTQSIEEPPQAGDFLRLLEHFDGMADHILLSTDYPYWDMEDPDVALPPLVPEEVQAGIRYDNARRLYGQ